MSTPNGPTYKVNSYRLRASGATPIGPGDFLVQGFGVDENLITTYEASTQLPDTEDFLGANPAAVLISANFQRLPYVDLAGHQIFQGTTVRKPEFKDETQMPGGSGRGWT